VEPRLVEFAGLLRANGVRVSPIEIADAVEAAALVGVADRTALRSALAATMVKRSADLAVFDGLFDLFFSGLGRILEGMERGLVEALREEGLLEGDDLEMIAQTLARVAGELSPLARAALLGDAALLARVLRGAAVRIDFSFLGSAAQVAFYGRRLLAGAGGAAMREDLAGLERALRERGLDPSRLEIVAAKLREALAGVEEAARRYADLERRARTERRGDPLFRPGVAPLGQGELART
jgi:uncharacterized protein with von Willebrand factor type A (vWA) domain